MRIPALLRLAAVVLPVLAAPSGATELEIAFAGLQQGLPQAVGRMRAAGRPAIRPATLMALQSGGIIGPEGGVYETGSILGRFVKANYEGMVFESWEVELMVGEFPDDPRYIGTTFKLSVEGNPTELLNKLNALDKSKNYIFKYKVPHWYSTMSPKYKVGYRLIGVEEAFAPAALPQSGLARSTPSRIGRYGNYLKNGARSGRIISTTRWGITNKVCAFELAFGGISAGESTDIHAIDFAVYAEEACSYVERLLKYQANVEIKYSQDSLEIWDSYERVAHDIIVLAASPASAAPKGDAQYEDFKNRLMNDPAFLDKLAEALAKKGG